MNEATTTSAQTLEQRRANHAWAAVQDIKVKGGRDNAKEYAGEAKKLPMRIQAAGLGQTLAFLLSKANINARDEKDKKRHLAKLHADLTDWVIEERPIRGKDPDSLLQSIIEGDADFLRRATDEALAYLQWLNRFAEAEGLTDKIETE